MQSPKIRTVSPPSGSGPGHPALRSQLRELGLRADEPPDPAGWRRLLDEVDARYAIADDLDRLLQAGNRSRSSFENLFRMSPTPTMEQDYTALVEWMDALRRSGVEDICAYLGRDADEIRRIVPMIQMIAVNPAAVRVIGLPEERLVGPIDPQIVNEGAIDSWLTQIEAVWTGATEARAVYQGASADGSSFDAELTLSAPLTDGAPDYSRVVVTIVDVSDHRNEERRMQNLIEAKNQFLASVSHEIRTPLTAVLGFTQVLVEQGEFSDEERDFMLRAIGEQTSDVANLVEDLLVAARTEIGQLPVADEPVDLDRLVGGLLESAGTSSIPVTIPPAPVRPRRVMGDHARIRQIIRNLLTNAERYGGPSVEIRIEEHHENLVLEVIDDGAGISPAEWERIFEPYYRAHATPGRPGSVGIGLAISRQLAERMGGSLKYERVDERSVFRLSLRRVAELRP